MYFIVARFPVKPESVADWPEITRAFTQATRAEPGNLFFDWSRSLDDDTEFVLVEGFTDDGAEPHVTSEHFAAGMEAMRPHLTATPKIISRQVEGDGWEQMGELSID